MEAAGLEIYAEVALLLFIVGFVFVLVRVFLMEDDEVERLEVLPLDDSSHAGDEVSQ
mgnify:CR=1 FL=1